MMVLRVIVFVLFLVIPVSAWGMEPAEVMVIANKRMSGSVELAELYMAKRNIPKRNLLILSLSLKEEMSRDEYENSLLTAVRSKIHQLKDTNRIEAIVTLYGVPLKVAPPNPGWGALDKIKSHEKEIKKVGKSDLSKSEKNKKIRQLNKRIRKLRKTDSRAAVDSELAVAKAKKYTLNGWVKNPYFLGHAGVKTALLKSEVLLVSRLDGPNKKTVRRMILDTISAEKNGLRGTAYFDARFKKHDNYEKSGYQRYDLSLHRASEMVQKRMDVVFDNDPELFKKDCCPDAALYCGWYSLAKYIESFKWAKGAVGYHMASAECDSLRDRSRNLWCRRMLEDGAVATIGPVHEPYIQGFPLPELFFGTFVEGYMTLGESYLVSLPYLSWQMVLIGDPLYQPFPEKMEVTDQYYMRTTLAK